MQPEWALEDVDLTRPSIARAYDFYLGGSHNFEIDREFARAAIAMMPNIPETMRAQRAYLRRAVRHLCSQGVNQFLDIGSGIPTVGNVHEVAQLADPAARVAYVDIDPVAVAHSRYLLRDNPQATAIRGDLRQPDVILTDQRVQAIIDFTRPVAVIVVGMLHFITDEADPGAIIGRISRALAPGSHVVMSHATGDSQPEQSRQVQDHSRKLPNQIWFRSREQIAAMFAGLTPVEPGVVWLSQWRPDAPEDVPDDPQRHSGYAGVFRRD